MPRTEIPAHLGAAFAYSDGRAAGITEWRLRGADLERVFHGVRLRRDSTAPTIGGLGNRERQRIRILEAADAYQARMQGHEFFSHSTAAMLWGLPLPMLPDDRVHVSVMPPHRALRARGLVGHEAQRHLTSVVTHPQRKLRLTSPATTWASLATVLHDPFDLVAAGDAVIRIPRMPGGYAKKMDPPLATLGQLEAAVRAGRRVGVARLREALPLLRTGSASRPESWTRLILVHNGLPEPVLDHDVFGPDGEFIGCVDLAYPRLRIAIEYEGDHHRTDAVTWQRDIQKHERLAELGWRVIRVTRDHVFRDPSDLARRVRSALSAAML